MAQTVRDSEVPTNLVSTACDRRLENTLRKQALFPFPCDSLHIRAVHGVYPPRAIRVVEATTTAHGLIEFSTADFGLQHPQSHS